MALYDEFRFKPAPWLPHSNLPLEELERVRNIKREDMEYTNENGYSVKIVLDPAVLVLRAQRDDLLNVSYAKIRVNISGLQETMIRTVEYQLYDYNDIPNDKLFTRNGNQFAATDNL